MTPPGPLSSFTWSGLGPLTERVDDVEANTGAEYGANIDDGCLSVDSRGPASLVAVSSGFNWVAAFRSPRTFTAATMGAATGSAAAGATPTQARFGLYLFDPVAGTGPLVAATDNDTTLFAAADTLYTAPLATPYKLTRGQWYAASVLIVTAASLPNIPMTAGVAGLRRIGYLPPIRSQLTSGHADLPANLTDPGVAGNFAPMIAIQS